MIQKSVTHIHDLDFGAILKNADLFYGPHGRFLKPLQRTKSPVIMRPAQFFCRFPHHIHVKRFLHLRQKAAAEHISNRIIPDPVYVRFPHRMQTRMKPRRCLLHGQHRHILRKIPVHIVPDLLRASSPDTPEADYLSGRMDTCVRPAGAVNFHWGALHP